MKAIQLDSRLNAYAAATPKLGEKKNLGGRIHLFKRAADTALYTVKLVTVFVFFLALEKVGLGEKRIDR